MSIYDSWYSGDKRNGLFTGYNPPATFKHGESTLVAEIDAGEDSDGNSVRVFEERWPATFWTIEALPGVNSINEPKAGYTIKTGSGQADLVAALVTAITTGMVGFYPLTTTPEPNNVL